MGTSQFQVVRCPRAELALCDADELVGIIDLIARSGQGKRIIRGGDLPDLDEVTSWINFAQHNRKLIAA